MYLFILLLLIIDYLSLWIESLYSRRWYEMFAQASVWNFFLGDNLQSGFFLSSDTKPRSRTRFQPFFSKAGRSCNGVVFPLPYLKILR